MSLAWLQDPSLVSAGAATLLPLLAFALILLFTRQSPRLSAALSLGAASGTLIGSVYLIVRHWESTTPLEYTGKWLVSAGIRIPFGYLLDPVSLHMLVLVAVVSLLVQIYSLGYMVGDPGFSRYYAFMSLFLWAMTSLTLSPTALQLYIFWELVGLCSYLLIGFWYERFSASQAGKKAFVMTRLGDVAFFLGILLVLLHLGNLSIRDMNGPELAARMPPHLVTLAGLLIFGGIVGKSAQFPLLTWLPDAMEGPTPVSALLHSATMVAAGVYLFGRLFSFFSLSATVMAVCLAVGTVSMLLSSTMALVSRDLKQIWAYSTISQLGFMFMGMAAGSSFAGAFHLTTHAGFKALLFLCSGVFVHAFETNDIFEIARRGGRRFKIPMVCLVLAAAALSGLPPLDGFFSKERIMGALGGLGNPIWVTAGLVGVFLTAYYAFRPIFVVLFPREVIAPAHEDGGRSCGLMVGPLLVLAASIILLDFAEAPLRRFLGGAEAVGRGEHLPWMPYVASLLALSGVAVAWLEFGRPGAQQMGFAERMEPLRRLFSERWYLDRFYRRLVELVVDKGLARLCAENDRQVVDSGIDGASRGTIRLGALVSYLHLGMIQHRLLALFAALVLMAAYVFFS